METKGMTADTETNILYYLPINDIVNLVKTAKDPHITKILNNPNFWLNKAYYDDLTIDKPYPKTINEWLKMYKNKYDALVKANKILYIFEKEIKNIDKYNTEDSEFIPEIAIYDTHKKYNFSELPIPVELKQIDTSKLDYAFTTSIIITKSGNEYELSYNINDDTDYDYDPARSVTHKINVDEYVVVKLLAKIIEDNQHKPVIDITDYDFISYLPSDYTKLTHYNPRFHPYMKDREKLWNKLGLI